MKQTQKLVSLLLSILLLVSMIVPASAAPGKDTFSDLPASHWAYAFGQRAFDEGIISGTYYNESTGERHFSPTGTVSIAQFLTVVTRACYPDEVKASTATGTWYAASVDVANQHGLMNGCGNAAVIDDASRYLMAVIMYNAMGSMGASMPTASELAYLQTAIADWNSIPESYRTPVATVFYLGIIQGVDAKGTFAGNKSVTRDQLAVIYCRLMDSISGSVKPLPKPEPEPVEQFSLKDVSAFSGKPFVAVNDNIPYFTAAERTTTSFEQYAKLDSLGRCGAAFASIGLDLMPTEERGSIGMVKPTGWHTVKYDCVDGKYLYNRCHLIGYQLSGENANRSNLITGTRYLNIEGMLPFENMIADYVQETGNHVLYRVTPIFEGKNLLPTGVLMEGLSVEDNGKDVSFCVFAYNAQPGVLIDYATGESQLDGSAPVVLPLDPEASEQSYVLNTNSMKFHYPDCPSVGKMSEHNKAFFTGSRDELIANGYDPCKNCNP